MCLIRPAKQVRSSTIGCIILSCGLQTREGRPRILHSRPFNGVRKILKNGGGMDHAKLILPVNAKIIVERNRILGWTLISPLIKV
jgi:hypothetical protein